MIKKIDHVNIVVTDLEQAKQFFIDLLDFELKKEGILEGKWIDKVVALRNVRAKYAQLLIPVSETCLELIEYYNPLGEKDSKISQANQIGFRHMAFEVKNIENIYQKLKDAGVKVFSDLQVYNEKKKI